MNKILQFHFLKSVPHFRSTRSIRCISILLCCFLAASNSYAANSRVLMETSLGDIELELYPDAAPITVANFLRYVDAGNYSGGSFYRTVRMNNQVQNDVKIEVIQGGIARGDSDDESSPFEPIVHESTEQTKILHKDGVISMARLEPGTASSDIFICINDQPELDFGGARNPDGQGFAAFGKVITGMDVVRKIHLMPTEPIDLENLEYTSGQIALEPVVIEKVSRINVEEASNE